MTPQKSDRYFYTALGVWAFLITAIGFSPTFYLRRSPDPLPAYIVWHGILASIWVIFFLLQTVLISAGQRRLHATLGLISIPLCVAVAATGALVTLRSIEHNGSPVWGVCLSLNNVLGLLFFVILGILHKHRPDHHKRFMVLAIVPFLGPAAARWNHAGYVPLWGTPALTFAPIVAQFAYDYLSRKSIHRVTLVGFPCVIAWHVMTVFLAKIPAFAELVRHLARLAS
jgi:hypothetical protein